MDANNHWYSLMHTPKAPDAARIPRILIIGAGSRGNAYAAAVAAVNSASAGTDSSVPIGIIAAVADPSSTARRAFGERYIWGSGGVPRPGQSFEGWREWIAWEVERRRLVGEGRRGEEGEGVDAVFVCTLDKSHVQVVVGMAEAGLGDLHVLCEKPLATSLEDCLRIWDAVAPRVDSPSSITSAASSLQDKETNGTASTASTPRKPSKTRRRSQKALFAICHVLRYSPHNTLLHRLVRHDRVIGDILSVEHTEPVGWWHFSHSYVRGHWRKTATAAPMLLTKACHDVDFLLWLCAEPVRLSQEGEDGKLSPPPPPHLPARVTSSGQLSYFRRARKPAAAGAATNCLSCAAEPNCAYSAKKIYVEQRLRRGVTGWPVSVVCADIEGTMKEHGYQKAEEKVVAAIGEDYGSAEEVTKEGIERIDGRPWFGRCVYESRNDVCDHQTVTVSWDDDLLPGSADDTITGGRLAKTATLHVAAHTEAQCERRGRISGTRGEISYDSKEIRVFDFASGKKTDHVPPPAGGGHGGGDGGLVVQFLKGVRVVMEGGDKANLEDIQTKFLGCGIEEVIRSHALVFAAEEARTQRGIIEWEDWWERCVDRRSIESVAEEVKAEERDRDWVEL